MEDTYNLITKPSHYVAGRDYEPKDVIIDWDLNFFLGNAVKYISRAGRKGDAIEDLQKAQTYLQFEIDRLIKQAFSTSGDHYCSKDPNKSNKVEE